MTKAEIFARRGCAVTMVGWEGAVSLTADGTWQYRISSQSIGGGYATRALALAALIDAFFDLFEASMSP